MNFIAKVLLWLNGLKNAVSMPGLFTLFSAAIESVYAGILTKLPSLLVSRNAMNET